MDIILYYIGFSILIYFGILWLGYTLFLLTTYVTIIRKYKESELNNILSTFNLNSLLPISIITPAYNEEKKIINAITSFINSEYKNLHLIVVNDGSTDSTLQLLIDTYCLIKIPPAFKKKIKTERVKGYYQSTSIPNFIVIDKEHSPANCAADCINAGLNVCRTPIFVTVDADTILEPIALSRMLFVHLSNPHCVAVGGDIYIPDPTKISEGKLLDTTIPSNPVLGIQVCEYLRSFLYGREGWSFLGGCLSFPGAFTMLEMQAVLSAKGFDTDNFAYDAEIIMKLHHTMGKNRFPYSIVYAPSAIAWSQGPYTLKQLWGQRNKWQRGLLRSLSQHTQMVLNPKYGLTGLLAFPYYILFEIFGPVVEAISYILFIFVLCFSSVSFSDLMWLFFLAWGYLTFITMSCVVLNTLTYNKYYRKMDVLRLFFLTTLDMLFYRQWRAFCAFFSSIQYTVNRIIGKPQ